MNSIRAFPLNNRSLTRFAILGALYLGSILLSLYFSYAFRFDFDIPPEFRGRLRDQLPWLIPFKLLVFFIFGQFNGFLSYFSLPDLRRLFIATTCSSGIIYGLWFVIPEVTPPRSVILADYVLTTVMLGGGRVGFRVFREKFKGGRSNGPHKRVVIVGAGDVGATLAKELLSKPHLGLRPVGFLDDDQQKWGSKLYGLPVIGRPELLENAKRIRIDSAIIAMPSAPAKRIREIVRAAQLAKMSCQIVPSMDQLATGIVKVSQVRKVEIEDLLGRDAVRLDTHHIRHLLAGKVVMVTGAGGSIGSELCRQIARYNPERLILLEQSEIQLFQIEQELNSTGLGAAIIPAVADILDQPRMRHLFERFRPNIIFHAAAHKHVPLMESQPSEAVKNNTLGTAEVANLAVEFQADEFVMISTDKAINPTNVMGASKRMAEIYLQALSKEAGKTKLMAVRFGNVLGSSGSVIPTFQKQIAAGGPVKVTHPDMQRYFMTIPEAVGLVLQSAVQGTGGEIFVLDMGSPVKILDLAKQMIELSGFEPEVDIEIEFSGLRPGEKLFEELCHAGENIVPTSHDKIMRYVAEPSGLATIATALEKLTHQMHEKEADQIKKEINRIVPEYKPFITTAG